MPALTLPDVARIAAESAGDGRVGVLYTSGPIRVICEVLFSKFLNSLTAWCLFFPPCRHDFDLHSLEWWSIIDVFAFAEKLRVPITHPFPLIAQGVFGFAEIRPEYTLSRIQFNCLYTHGALAQACLDGLWHGGEFCPLPPPLFLLHLTDNPPVELHGDGAVGEG